MLLIIATLPLSLIIETKADTELILSGVLGLFLVSLAHAAIGLFMSTLSRNPGIAANQYLCSTLCLLDYPYSK